MLHKKKKGRAAASTAIRTDLYCCITTRHWSKSHWSLKRKLSQRSPGCPRCLLSEPWKEGGKWQELIYSNSRKQPTGLGESSALSMQRVFAVVKQRGCQARALQLLRTRWENISASDLKHLLGRESESTLLIVIPCFICCLVLAVDLYYFHCSSIQLKGWGEGW